MSAEAPETTETAAEARSRNKWNLDPSLSEADKRKKRRQLRAELKKAQATGEYSDELKASLAEPATTATPSGDADADDEEEGGEDDDEEAELRRRRRRERREQRATQRASTRSSLAKAATPAKVPVEVTVAELRGRLTENLDMDMGYMFSFSDGPSADQLIEKFTARWGQAPTEFRLDRMSTVLLGPVPR